MAADAAFWPSEYTGALIQTLRQHPDWVVGASALEIGCGSGALLAALATLGARALTGVDIEAQAVAQTSQLLAVIEFPGEVDILRGDLYAPVAQRRFDLIVANLPNFPMAAVEIGGRLATWSSGGASGRRLLDPFIAGLGQHLEPTGRAVFTQNGFIGLDATYASAERQGLRLTIAATLLVHLPPPKLARITEAVLALESGRSIHRFGPHSFGEVHVVVAEHSRSETPSP